VEVADHAILGGLVAVHQYVRIGELALLGGGAMVPLDVPPYMCACGDRARLYGLNTIGLRRHGYKRQTIRNLKRAYRILFRCKLPLKEALDKLREKFRDPAVARLEEFIRSTQRGICRE
jgi:UDP-N-acetylglucosamine acyltransferase